MTASFFINHLWQSSCFVLLAGLLAFVLRRSPPKVRYWIWLSASLKFLLPLALLVSLGRMVPRPDQRVVLIAAPVPTAPAPTAPVFSPAVVQIAEPSTLAADPTVPAQPPTNWTPVAIAIGWTLGFLAIASVRCRSWFRIRSALRAATPIELAIPIPALIAPGATEPGIVGFLRPVLVLPPQLLEHLNSQQLDAILAHEMCHVRRRDNLFAAVHMVVEAIFWFHPLVWWIGSRMVEERERACDEAVLQMGCEPADYAAGILKVCRFYTESPLACVSGVTGADVKKRLRTILAGSVAREWNAGKKVALAAVGLATLAVPIVIGVLSEPAIRTVFAQSPDTRPRFLAADVHASPPPPVGALPLTLRTVPVYADRYQLDNATIPDMIGIAWGFQTDKIVGGPTWLELDRFNIIAKLPADTTPEDQKRMLQTLLEERFHLVVHKDTKSVPGYTLTVAARKPALRAATGSEKSGCAPSSEPGGIASWGSVNGGPTVNHTIGPGNTIAYNCRNITMNAFVQGLHSMLGTSGLGPGPVLDETHLKGAWNFDLRWTLDGVHVDNGPAARVTLFDTLDRQLGLKLEESKVPAPALVVDSVNRTPTANASDLARLMPPIPPVTRFDVASVKPSDPGSTRSGIHIQPGGRVTLEGMPMTGLFQLAFSGHAAENMPKWADSDRFDIVAKTPPGTVPLDRTTLGLPLQALLRDRFRLTYHTEQRPATAYILQAVKPKLKKADPASRMWCKHDLAPASPDGGARRLTCQNVTMAEFADLLPQSGAGVGPVSDATGLKGAWDLTLIYADPMTLMYQTQRIAEAASSPGGVPVAPDPTVGYSIFEAIQRQLGLRLQATKGFRSVMIIDHIEEKPVGQ